MTDKEEFDLIGNINVAEPNLGIQIGKTPELYANYAFGVHGCDGCCA